MKRHLWGSTKGFPSTSWFLFLPQDAWHLEYVDSRNQFICILTFGGAVNHPVFNAQTVIIRIQNDNSQVEEVSERPSSIFLMFLFQQLAILKWYKNLSKCSFVSQFCEISKYFSKEGKENGREGRRKRENNNKKQTWQNINIGESSWRWMHSIVLDILLTVL